MPIDSESLVQVFHEHGINMRYLSHVAVMSQVPHIQDICLTEMLARTCKNIINSQLSQLILENKEKYEELKIVQKMKNKILHEKENYSNTKTTKPNESHTFEESMIKTEIQEHLADQMKISNGITARLHQDMNKKTHELIVDMFNLIFGRSEETD